MFSLVLNFLDVINSLRINLINVFYRNNLVITIKKNNMGKCLIKIPMFVKIK